MRETGGVRVLSYRPTMTPEKVPWWQAGRIALPPTCVGPLRTEKFSPECEGYVYFSDLTRCLYRRHRTIVERSVDGQWEQCFDPPYSYGKAQDGETFIRFAKVTR